MKSTKQRYEELKNRARGGPIDHVQNETREVYKLVNPERCEMCCEAATYQVVEDGVDHFLCDSHIEEEDKSIAR